MVPSGLSPGWARFRWGIPAESGLMCLANHLFLHLLQIIVNYIKRGQGGEASDRAGALADVKGKASKQAFTWMSRTSFSSMYRSILRKREKRLFKKIVRKDEILK